MNLSFVGNLGNEPALKFAANGSSYCFFSVAMDTAKQGDKRSKTIWWSCVAFQEVAEEISINFKKGDVISVNHSTVQPIPDKRTGGTQLQVQVWDAGKLP
ncbi:MAG: single-stranded DNA-binding protein [Deltaproteobacteria bacterium]|nr:single-stranded DNA-binding protein [Deltaproteobacteria bacterium]